MACGEAWDSTVYALRVFSHPVLSTGVMVQSTGRNSMLQRTKHAIEPCPGLDDVTSGCP